MDVIGNPKSVGTQSHWIGVETFQGGFQTSVTSYKGKEDPETSSTSDVYVVYVS